MQGLSPDRGWGSKEQYRKHGTVHPHGGLHGLTIRPRKPFNFARYRGMGRFAGKGKAKGRREQK
ncbi:predicted protein [Coccidioides posadasii str. Silveira]|uniref:Predicted protein n=1 Tax=Coccidioides posadasii (strain RMSCC 757 / Silveira) TaxID=443226 RepID=E9DGB0_COCPS|nr:predicted protein [Coccidioides posadasii str. Silveira]